MGNINVLEDINFDEQFILSNFHTVKDLSCYLFILSLDRIKTLMVTLIDVSFINSNIHFRKCFINLKLYCIFLNG